MLTLSELVRWTGMSIFEMWMHLVGLFITTILLAIKVHTSLHVSFFLCFSPLMAASVFNVYFIFIVLVRSMIEFGDCKAPIVKFGWSAMRVGLIAAFERLLYLKVLGELEPGEVTFRYTYGIVFLPIWFLMGALCVQVCRMM